MKTDQARAFYKNAESRGIRPGLERIRELMDRLGNPQDRTPYIHVAGTNGKGSVALMTAQILSQAGYRTGLFRSPAVTSFEDQVQVDGRPISPQDLARETEKIQAAANQMVDPPTSFEALTALALLHFTDQSCDLAVIEVGMGGLEDSTNVIPPPRLALITRLGLDHLGVLGNSLAEIAGQKAGIIKRGTGVALAYPSEEEGLAVVADRARTQAVPFQVVDSGRVSLRKMDLDGQVFDWVPSEGHEGMRLEGLTLPLLGRHQLTNVSLVLTGIEALRTMGYAIPDEAIRRGLSTARLACRMEVLRKDPLFLLDGGHNPQGVASLVDLLRDLSLPPVHFLMGMLKDKDVDHVIDLVLPLGASFTCITPDHPTRALSGEDLAQKIQKKGGPAQAFSTMEEGLDRALATGQPVVASGSFYTAGPLRKLFLKK
ncbi:folylpolyglutamate synthase/dihydrofolate synthase family protein [Kallipyga massiliensis]|uniref:bifunctional folylpolyglutamate synthase/dihydrofolate synthase n=1 Tax=Kallipyga massiliensis TaxID=1472764 RepID=UPI0026F20FDF|nr:folylpolyglutamate synthase/dihydrofolate synthase family protein [Kallipyga massiliensis]